MSVAAPAIVYVPAEAPLAKVAAEGVIPDAVILDLEESTAADRKDQARAAIAYAVDALGGRARYLAVRINDLGSPEGLADCEMARKLPAHVRLVVPKTLTVERLTQVLELTAGRPIWLMAEERSFAASLPAYLDALSTIELAIVGIKDLAHDLGSESLDRNDPSMLVARRAIAAAAWRADLPVVDSVAFGTPDDIAAACAQAAAEGFAGVTLLRWRDAAHVQRSFADHQSLDNTHPQRSSS